MAIDTVPLPEKVVRGRLDRLGEGYVLTVGRRKLPLAVGSLVDPAGAAKLAGKSVAVAFSARRAAAVVAIGTWPTPEVRVGPRCYWWTCYIPIPELLKGIRDEIRRRYAVDLVKNGTVSPALAKEIGLR